MKIISLGVWLVVAILHVSFVHASTHLLCSHLFNDRSENNISQDATDSIINSFENSGEFKTSFRQLPQNQGSQLWGEIRIETIIYNERSNINQTATVGTLSFSYEIKEPHTLHLIMVRTQPGFKKKGVSTYLFAKLFKNFPEIRRLELELALDNEAVYRTNPGTSEEKLVNTPAYKSLVKFGFIKIIEVAKRPSPLPPPFDNSIPVVLER